MVRNRTPFWRIVAAGVSLLAFGSIVSVAGPLAARAQAVIVVDGDGHGAAGDCSAAPVAYATIQAGVDAASPGDTVLVCPGTYNEQVVVRTPNLTILGADRDAVVIQPSIVYPTTDRPSNLEPVAPILLVDSVTNVTIADLTVDGSLADQGAAILPCGRWPFYAGIYYRLTSGHIENSHVTHINSDTRCAFGVLVQSGFFGTGPYIDVTISNNLVDDYGEQGIACYGQDTTCTIVGNTVRGDGPVDDHFQNGIGILAEAKATIKGNTITDNFYAPGKGMQEWSVGIWLRYADPSVNGQLLRDNTFANNQANVQRAGSAAAFE